MCVCVCVCEYVCVREREVAENENIPDLEIVWKDA